MTLLIAYVHKDQIIFFTMLFCNNYASVRQYANSIKNVSDAILYILPSILHKLVMVVHVYWSLLPIIIEIKRLTELYVFTNIFA